MEKNIFRNNLDTENLEVKIRQEQRTNKKTTFQTYLFEFGTDEKLYSSSFKGKIQYQNCRTGKKVFNEIIVIKQINADKKLP